MNLQVIESDCKTVGRCCPIVFSEEEVFTKHFERNQLLALR